MDRVPLITRHSTHSLTNSLRLPTSHMHRRAGEMLISTGRTRVRHQMTPPKQPLMPMQRPGLHIMHNTMGSRVASLHRHPSLRKEALLQQCRIKQPRSSSHSSSLHKQGHLQVHNLTTAKPG